MKKRHGTTHRFFLIPFVRKGDEFVLRDEEQLHQLVHVLRMRAEDTCEVLDNTGAVYQVRLDLVSKKEVRGTILSEEQIAQEDRKVWLCFGILKGARNEFIFEKATELGVTEIQPVVFQRSQPFPWSPNKVRRFEAIVREATEQSEGVVLPVIHEPVTLEKLFAKQDLPDVRMVVWEKAETQILPVHNAKENVCIFVGPEGGITEEEIVYLEENGAKIYSLGHRILRAETATIASLARTIL